MSAVRFENTARSSSGMPAISACPLTIGRQSTPKRCGELGPQHRLVEAAEHPLVPLQVAGVEGQPAAVGCLDLGRDDGVGVDLRVIGPRGGLAERGHRQPVGVRVQAAAVGADAGRRPEPLQMRQRRGDGDVVGFEEPVVAGERPPHRQRLRRRERRVEPRHRPHHPTVGRVPVQQLAPQRCPRRWVTARQQRLQRVDLDPTRQAEPGRLAARPHTRDLTRRRRQVLGVVLRRRCRRRRVEGRHPQHRPTPHPRPRLGTCLL